MVRRGTFGAADVDPSRSGLDTFSGTFRFPRVWSHRQFVGFHNKRATGSPLADGVPNGGAGKVLARRTQHPVCGAERSRSAFAPFAARSFASRAPCPVNIFCAREQTYRTSHRFLYRLGERMRTHPPSRGCDPIPTASSRPNRGCDRDPLPDQTIPLLVGFSSTTNSGRSACHPGKPATRDLQLEVQLPRSARNDTAKEFTRIR
jgi:hypothetical protein